MKKSCYYRSRSCCPNGVGLDDFTHAIKNGISGIKHDPELERLQFSCQIAGNLRFLLNLRCAISELELRNFNSTGILYGVIAGLMLGMPDYL
jgi:hypothetical protein